MLRRWSPLWLLAVLAGCGGGGSGDTNPIPIELVTLSGQATFDFIPAITGASGLPRLDYNAIETRPARRVGVQIVNDQTGAVIGATMTGEDGSYSVAVPQNTVVKLRARAELLQSGNPGWNVRVVDNTQANALFALDSTPFDTGATDSTRDLHAGSGWTGSAYTEPRSAAPFAILDTVVDGMQFLLAVDPALNFPPLTLHWSPDNRSVSGPGGFPDPDSGAIGGTIYSPELGGIFLLGRENDDTEEYDRGVILHEWGHYVEDSFFRSDSVGGPHTLGDRLDMRVAFGEGFASAFAAMILGDGTIRDTFGFQQRSGFTIEVENLSGLNSGWYSEESIQGILYDLFDTVQDTPEDQLALGFGPMYDVLANEQRDSVALTSLFPFILALKTNLLADAASIDALLLAQTIAPIIDEYGLGRTNPLPPSDVLPIYTDVLVNGGPVSDICSTDAFGASLADPESVNKLGSRRFLKFTATVTANHTFTATATLIPFGEEADPDMELHQRGALLPFPLLDPPGKSGLVNVETFSWPLTPGDYVLEVYEWSNTNARNDPVFPPIGRTCFDVEITTP